MNAKDFAKQFLLDEVVKMEAASVPLHLLMAIMQGIETAGAHLDPLPFKAKGQGKKRFRLALTKLFPTTYSLANQNLDLYGQLRSHLSHCMIPSNTVSVDSNSDTLHLQLSEKVLHISLPLLYHDYCCAMELLIGQLETGQLKNKKIKFENLNGLLDGNG